MLNESQATDVVKRALPGADIRPPIQYKGLYVFQVFRNIDPDEDLFDPFYSVDANTGVLQEFSIITDAHPDEITALFKAKQRQTGAWQ